MRDSTRGSLPDRASRRPRALDHRQLPVAVRAPDLPAVGRLADRSARRYPSRAITLCPRHRRTTPRRGSGGRFQGNCRENCPEGVTAVTARAAFPLVKHRAAYRNRTDDLFITREDRSPNVLSNRARCLSDSSPYLSFGLRLRLFPLILSLILATVPPERVSARRAGAGFGTDG